MLEGSLPAPARLSVASHDWAFASGASIDGMAPRVTGVLRQWLQNDSGYPANWMPDVIRMLPKQVLTWSRRSGVAVMKEELAQPGRSFCQCAAWCFCCLFQCGDLLLARGVARRGQRQCVWPLAHSRQIVAAALTESVLLPLRRPLSGFS